MDGWRSHPREEPIQRLLLSQLAEGHEGLLMAGRGHSVEGLRSTLGGQGVLKRNQLAAGMKSRQPQGVKSCDSVQRTGMAAPCAICDA